MTNYQKLMNNFEVLKLNSMITNFKTVQDKIIENKVSIVDSMLELTNLQIEFSNLKRKDTMVKIGAFPHKKRLTDFDFNFQPDLNKNKLLEFESLAFIENKENIVFYGNSGVGKTHLSVSIGISAAEKGIKTYFIKCNDLIQNLKKAKLENVLEKKLKNYSRYKLLIIDEVGYLPIDKEDSKLLFQLIDMRYEEKSTIITTNIHFSKWNEIFRDEMLASAILDRILHHAHVVSISGNSYRLKNHVVKD
ncbi:Insertion sequence IS5376 putative ATP-binding protein [Oceanivirga miroungae]|uniref:Insertion sequence IS5376 putative ATP-binding protein n=2 Tax=Oceanivirga miroungae TaxID=1130046 RepID=A0A6I8M8Q1_9FUSO|nr:Insertion sequence IS5376 putative ATP-binding protein [Oceanivirga miroungae]VWL85906.1 Insertion sequence IS5376 putative ATP-binding protein [Oceanivirga miroungae]